MFCSRLYGFVLAFDLGKFLDFLGQLAEDLAKSSENLAKSEGSKSMPKVGQARKLEKACTNLQNRALTLPKPMPKPSKTVFTRKVVFRTAPGEQHQSFRKALFLILGRLGFQDGPKFEAKAEPTLIKNRCANLEGILETQKFRKIFDLGGQYGAKLG